jgi:hypothetical protein
VLLERCPDCEATSLRTGKARLPLGPERAEVLTRGAERDDGTQRGARGDRQVIPKAVQEKPGARNLLDEHGAPPRQLVAFEKLERSAPLFCR